MLGKKMWVDAARFSVLLFCFAVAGCCARAQSFQNVATQSEWPSNLLTSSALEVYKFFNPGTFVRGQTSVAMGDFNGDDRSDLLIAGLFGSFGSYEFSSNVQMYFQRVGGAMEDVSSSAFAALHAQAWWKFGTTSSYYTVQTIPSGAPGFDDFIVCTRAFFKIYRNQLNGSFVVAPAGYISSPPGSCWSTTSNHIYPMPNTRPALFDLAQDQEPDLFVPHIQTPNSVFGLWTNNGSGWQESLTRWIPGGIPSFIGESMPAMGDFNADGKDDLLVFGSDIALTAVNYLYLFVAENSTYVQAATGIVGGLMRGALVVSDFDGDGYADIFATGNPQGGGTIFGPWYVPGTPLLLANNGNLTFDTTRMQIPELPNVNMGGAASLWLNFTTPTPDLVVSGDMNVTSGPFTALFKNDGKGNFTRSSHSMPQVRFSTILVGSLAAKGSTDVIVIGSGELGPSKPSLAIYSADPGIQDLFQTTTNFFPLNQAPRSLSYASMAVGDFSSRGCVDIALQGLVRNTGVIIGELMGGNCNSSFLSVASPIVPLFRGAMLVEDIDRDGFDDLFATGTKIFSAVIYSEAYVYYGSSAGLEINNNESQWVNGSFAAFSEGAAVFMHADGDSFRDLVCIGFFNNSRQTKVFLNQGAARGFLDASGMIQPAIPGQARGFVMAFEPTDQATGFDDAFLMGDSQYFYLQNLRNGTLKSTAAPGFINNMVSLVLYSCGAPADFNEDGFADLVVSTSDDMGVYRNMQNLTWTRVISSTLWSVGTSNIVVSDFDLDGVLEVLLSGTNSATSPGQFFAVSIYANFTAKDRTAFFVPSNISMGFSNGAIAVATFHAPQANRSDHMRAGNNATGYPFLVGAGESGDSGIAMLTFVAAPVASSSTTSTSVGTSGSGGPVIEDETTDILRIILIAIGSCGGVLLLIILFVLLCLCCLCCVILLLLVVVAVAAAIALLAAAGVGVVIPSATGVAVSSKLRKRGQGAGLLEYEEQGVLMSAVELERYAASVTAYQSIQWNELQIVRKLGQGAFGDVLLAEWNGVEVAVKVIRHPTEEAFEEFEHEALMMAKVSHHPNMVRFLGVSVHDDDIAMVMTLCAGGHLLGALERKAVNEAEKVRILREVAGALAFLHTLGVVHRDLAARNVLLDKHKTAKLADFGLSRAMEAGASVQCTSSFVGPVRWMAPECLTRREYSPASDAYAFGVLMYEVWSDGIAPYSNIRSIGEVAVLVVQQDARPGIPESAPEAHASLMKRLWQRDPMNRPQLSEVFHLLTLDSPVAESDATLDTSKTSHYSSISQEEESKLSISSQYIITDVAALSSDPLPDQ